MATKAEVGAGARLYQIFDIALCSDFPLPGLPELAAADAGLTVRLGDGALDDTEFELVHVWNNAGGAVITLKDDPLFSTVIPSKIFESMGMGLPILLSLPEGEAARIIRDSGAGLVILPEDPAQLTTAVTGLADDRAARDVLPQASAAAAAAYSRDAQAAKMLHRLESLGGQGG